MPSVLEAPHLDAELVAELFDGDASASAKAAVEAHAADCGPCRRLLSHVAAALSDSAGGRAGPATDEELVRLVAAPLPQLLARSRLGTTLAGKWVLESLLGVGGMAQVFSARHRTNGRRVAVKLLRPELTGNASIVRRFGREGYVANQVGHAGAIAVLDDGVSDEGLPFFIMDLLEGETLRERLGRRGKLATSEALRLTIALLDVLGAAHVRGIVHRDIKPENLFITTSGELKVLDFGIARLRESSDESITVTNAGLPLGTPLYMPPEQARGKSTEVDARSDVFAVGATLFFMLTGRPVRQVRNASEALYAAMVEPVGPVRALAPSLLPELAGVLDRALAADRHKRFPDARAMQGALTALRLSDERASRNRGRTWLVGALVLAVAVVTAAAHVLSFELRDADSVRTTASAALADLPLPPSVIPPTSAGILPEPSTARPRSSGASGGTKAGGLPARHIATSTIRPAASTDLPHEAPDWDLRR